MTTLARTAALVLLLWSAPALAASHAAWDALAMPAPLRALLDSGRWDQTPRGFRIVTLSFLADACVARAARQPAARPAAQACVTRALELAERTRPEPAPADPSDHGLWLTHHALLLGARDRLGPCPDPAGHRAVAEALARRTVREPTHHVPSYPGVAYRWPADETATLAALARFDQAHGTKLAEEPAALWKRWMLENAIDSRTGLPWSEATGRAPGARTPRGCALSWQTRYLHELDPALARRWWGPYQARWRVERLGLAGLREWPPGRERPADADSGPIVGGVGAAATALGIAAARTMGDDRLAGRFESTATWVKAAAGASPALARQARTALAEVIRWLGAEARP